MNLSLIDYFVIVLYFSMVLSIGIIAKRRVKNLTDYFLAGRRLTLPIFVATLVSTWYGGILGVGELSFNYGIVNWLTQGFFWYLSYLFFAFFLANRIRRSRLYTIPDQMEKFYDKKSRFLSAIFNFLMVTPAPYVFSLGIIFSLLFGWAPWVGIVIGTAITVIYTIQGGFVSVVYTDFLQFFLMITGVALVIPFAVSRFGGIDWLMQNVPASHFTLTGGWTTQMILVWGFIAFWTLVDPGFYQRCYAARDSNIPRNGILLSILFWIMFDICTTFIGIYARAAMPGINPVTALPIFADLVLPAFVKGLFFAGLLATVMSTIDSFTFLGAMNLSHDIYRKTFNPKAGDAKVIWVTRWGIIITAGFAMVIALSSESIVSMWYTIGTIGISALLVPMMFGFFSKKKAWAMAGFLSMIAGSSTSVIWLLDGYLKSMDGWPMYMLGLEPLYPGLASSLFMFLVVRWMR